ncbi:CENP-N/CHL4 family protein [Aspergillus saccharolyticus JOP 1030-1]|uniref:CHL4-domain-containing protein n=1 Tax=Aspergillus saccharolyticus JOP 1030-1 TaxID=1450539 RepID=A0A318Z640_9EURO|nr:CHL4-domain-containing protein [Aspergillus saccharolyticus JOP 1030-1]PYH41847.1 CHL4-domain-containing protein [Aspergillus saccharolyticus JOP 1030-1]
MARSKYVRAPTTASLPGDLRIPSSTPSLVKTFSKLTRQALLDLVFQWLDDRNIQNFAPYLQEVNEGTEREDDGDDEGFRPYPAERTINGVRNAYQELQFRKGGKREVIERILDGDWRHGVTLRQLAMVDLRYIDDHPSCLRWTALELVQIGVLSSNNPSACIPRVHASTFLSGLQREISPLVKAHYHLGRLTSLPLTVLRVFVTTSPYQIASRQNAESLTDSSRTIYVAFPDSCPFIYTSIASSPVASKAGSATQNSPIATDSRSLQRLVRDAIPKALSLPHQRYTLKPTSLTAKSLEALLSFRGPGRSNRAGGAFSIFADAALEGSPLDPRPSSTVSPEEHVRQSTSHHLNTPGGKENTAADSEEVSYKIGRPPKRSLANIRESQISKKRALALQARFGSSGALSSAPLDRLDVRLLDALTGDAKTEEHAQQTPISLTFTGTDVIGGFRKLAELGIVDAERMPSWMTGEEGVSTVVVREGKRVTKAGG